MEKKGRRGGAGWLSILFGSAAIIAGILILVFPGLGLLFQVLILAGGLLVIGVAKISTARRGRHLTPLLRRFGLGMGAITITIAAIVLVSA
ncbi:MAG: DUF308 domain-containing protein, partial [Thermoplasmata archaeon]